ncbi:MAG: tRNA (adenosine(37)-N6)-threonylcarbamoyltransferase complex transferase subunit TsaD [Flavobacteriia bacterium]
MRQKDIIILGIESSCDDTSAAVLKNNTILSNLIARQDIHEQYGGVVPELASRAHQQNIIPVVDEALKKAGVTKEEIDAVAFTRGPGLMGSLVVGTSFAKAFSLALNIPMLDVNHMVGHVLAHFIDDEGKDQPDFPFLCLTVSGGHTQIVLVEDHLKMKVIGSTIDDAAGEAFDKAAKLLGFPYPGGPYIDKHAKNGDPARFTFSKPSIPEYNYSFSGLKTSILYFLQKESLNDPTFIEKNLDDLCASIQRTVIEILLKKLIKASNELKIKHIAIAGGVSANSGLRSAMHETGEALGWKVFIPKFEYCTDNAAMIAITGKFMFQKGLFADQSIAATARYSMNDIHY